MCPALGVEWLGDVPEHWEVKRLGSIGFSVVTTSPQSNGFPVRSQSYHPVEL